MAAQDPTVSTASNAVALVVTAYLMLALSWLSVLLRSYVRGFLTNGFLADDWWMLLSQANFTISCAFILRGVSYGLGRHNKSLDVLDEIYALKFQALATATYVLNMWLIKMSIALFLLRIATQKRYRYTLYVSITIVTIWSLVLFFWNLFQCRPFQAQWDYRILQNDKTAHCVSSEEVVNAAYALSIMTILSDWLYALLPIPMVWNVKMTLQAKMTVTLVLGLGIFASIATLIRLKFLADLNDTADILHSGTDAMVWTLIEPGVAITASSLITIRPLLRAWKISGFQSTERSRSGFRSERYPSQVNRMPGFGSADATLVDVEQGTAKSGAASDHTTWTAGKAHRPKGSHMVKVSEEAEEEEEEEKEESKISPPPPARLDPGFHRVEIRSNAGHAEAPLPSAVHSVHGTTWLESDQSSNNSTIELNDLSPQQSQGEIVHGLEVLPGHR